MAGFWCGVKNKGEIGACGVILAHALAIAAVNAGEILSAGAETDELHILQENTLGGYGQNIVLGVAIIIIEYDFGCNRYRILRAFYQVSPFLAKNFETLLRISLRKMPGWMIMIEVLNLLCIGQYSRFVRLEGNFKNPAILCAEHHVVACVYNIKVNAIGATNDGDGGFIFRWDHKMAAARYHLLSFAGNVIFKQGFQETVGRCADAPILVIVGQLRISNFENNTAMYAKVKALFLRRVAQEV